MKPEEYQDSVRSLRDFYAGVSDSSPERLRALAGSRDSERKEPCDFCGMLVTEWVTPDWTTNRVCLDCEPIHEPKPENAKTLP